MQVLPACSLSRGVPSTSRPRLRNPNNEARMIPYRAYLVKRKSLVESTEGRCRRERPAPRYFSSMATEILISEVEIIWMLMPSSARALNILEATPGWERMPTPTADGPCRSCGRR